VFPTLRYWERSALGEIVSGSGSFGILEMSTFLVYSAPLLVMQRVLGPVVVAAFILMRTIFSMCRQVLAVFTQSMAAEITTLFGRRDWPLLTRLYTYSERMIFFLIAVVNLTVLMLSPALIRLWMHRRGATGGGQLFAVYPYVLCSAVSMVISFKEHKHQFQFSTNTHRELARVVLVGYTAMVLVSFASVPLAGVIGFLWTWLTVESVLTWRLVAMNRRLFAHMETIDTAYIPRLVVLGAVGLVGAGLALPHTSALPLAAQAGIASLVALLLGAVCWQVFRVRPVYALMLERLRRRAA
jgi:O-antigen/teichoic acid export membrane protein